jgi:uncharacterized protein involved in exopolysaccharide biosynthesis
MTDNHPNNTASSNNMTLKDIILKISQWIKYLISQWKIIILGGIVGLLIGGTYYFLKRPTYYASTTFVLEEDKAGGGLGSLAGLASMAGVDLASGGGIFEGDNILALYKSRSMIEKTLLTKIEINNKSQLLIDRYIELNGLRDKWKKEELKNIDFNVKLQSVKGNTKVVQLSSRLQDSLLGSIFQDINKNYLQVSRPDKKLSIIRVEVSSKDEIFSKAFTDLIVENVNNFYVQTKVKKSKSNVDIIDRQADSVRRVMNGAIFSAATTMDNTPNINLTRQVLRAPIQRSQFNAEANKVILGELVKNLELAKMQLRKETPLIQVIDQPIYPLNNDKPKPTIIAVFFFLFMFLSCVVLLGRYIFSEIMAD